MTLCLSRGRQLEPYCKQPRVHEILHIKCPIIRLVRCQMAHVECRLTDTIDNCQRRKKLSYKLWKNRWMILSLIFTLLLMISLFLYGTMVGAGLCSSTSWTNSYRPPCSKTLSFLPGINLVESSKLPF
ncbi:hypothetical protein NQ317_004897 [Molorchus minor]|uniref:Uncharacterized protein n=1 Tax=Molorchus minor TaxID=1323400 RepID=A0ABQ9J1R6_9CUCU|nr:hypothetical protein NQ317_004897 [Molorchus minor]